MLKALSTHQVIWRLFGSHFLVARLQSVGGFTLLLSSRQQGMFKRHVSKWPNNSPSYQITVFPLSLQSSPYSDELNLFTAGTSLVTSTVPVFDGSTIHDTVTVSSYIGIIFGTESVLGYSHNLSSV